MTLALAPETLDVPPALADTDLVAIDTETTGLWWGERLVELGAVRFRGDRVIARWRTLVDPCRSIPEGVSKIHGLSDADVAGAPRAREVLRKLLAFCEGAVLLAHNATFDRDILATELARAGMDAPESLKVGCTWRLAKRTIAVAPRYGLAALASHLGFPTESPHRALADAELTRRLYLECLGRGAELSDDLTFPLAGAVRRVRDLPRSLRPLRVAKALGHAVTLSVSPLVEGEEPMELRGVPALFYARGSDQGIDLDAGEGKVHSLGAERIVSVR